MICNIRSEARSKECKCSCTFVQAVILWFLEPFRTIRNGNRIDQWWSMVFNLKKYDRSSLNGTVTTQNSRMVQQRSFSNIAKLYRSATIFQITIHFGLWPMNDWMSRTGTHELDPCPLVLGIKISDDQWWNTGKPFYCIQYGNLQFHLTTIALFQLRTPPPKSWPEKTVKAFTKNIIEIYS